ncbi:transmembrane protein 106A-like [Arapaima gigas]
MFIHLFTESSPNRCTPMRGPLGQSSTPQGCKEPVIPKKGEKRKHSWKDYGSIGWETKEDTLDCPTCRGTGRIPKGQKNQLVAVIPCSDQRLGPQHTKLYVCLSVLLCLVVCILVIFFLFPRSVLLSPVAIKSVSVYFTPNMVNITITNVLNITNKNYFSVELCDLDVQTLFGDIVVGKAKIRNVTMVKPRSRTEYTYDIPVFLDDPGLNTFCKSTAFKIHTLFLHLQITVRVLYLAHSEQLSTDTFEYIDCGTNTTIPHFVQDSLL